MVGKSKLMVVVTKMAIIKTILAIIYSFVSARHFANCFTYLISFNPHNYLVRQKLVSPFLQMRKLQFREMI